MFVGSFILLFFTTFTQQTARQQREITIVLTHSHLFDKLNHELNRSKRRSNYKAEIAQSKRAKAKLLTAL